MPISALLQQVGVLIYYRVNRGAKLLQRLEPDLFSRSQKITY